MRKQLHEQADQIEAVLARYKLPAKVAGGTVAPRLVFYKLAPAAGVGLSQVADLEEEVATALGAPSCRVYHNQGAITIEVPRGQPQAVTLMNLGRRLVEEGPQGRDTVPPHTAVLGLDQEGVPLLLRFPAPNVRHCLIAGDAGAGKSSVLRAMAISLMLFNLGEPPVLQLALAGLEFGRLVASPLLIGSVADSPLQRMALLKELSGELSERQASSLIIPRIVLVLDEPAPGEMGLLLELLEAGFEAGIHLVVAMDGQAARELEPYCPILLQGRAMAGRGLVRGADQLLGAGDFLLRARGQTSRLAAAYIDDRDLAEVMATIGQRREHPAALPVQPGRGGRRVLSVGRA